MTYQYADVTIKVKLENNVNRRSYMSACILLNLLNELGKVIKGEACRAFYYFFATNLINSIM